MASLKALIWIVFSWLENNQTSQNLWRRKRRDLQPGIGCHNREHPTIYRLDPLVGKKSDFLVLNVPESSSNHHSTFSFFLFFEGLPLSRPSLWAFPQLDANKSDKFRKHSIWHVSLESDFSSNHIVKLLLSACRWTTISERNPESENSSSERKQGEAALDQNFCSCLLKVAGFLSTAESQSETKLLWNTEHQSSASCHATKIKSTWHMRRCCSIRNQQHHNLAFGFLVKLTEFVLPN